MKRLLPTIILFFIAIVPALATHERAGEILFKHIEGLTYEITIITYTYSPSPADRPELEIMWGDGTSSVLPRVSITVLTSDIQRNEYVGEHTYSGSGTFNISLEDPNRNFGIVNIPNSVNIPFYIETQLIINQFLGPNNSPILLNPPLDYGCVNRLYVHNPGAYDPDGDSLSYRLTVCRGANGLPIPGYSLPAASNKFKIDEISGDLIWDKPEIQGEYNVAFVVEEWRNGTLIGAVTRDLQILIDACDNEPPIIPNPPDTCITAGDQINLQISASDPNGDLVALYANGSPFLQNSSPAVMTPNPAYGNGNTIANFEWSTNCSHIRKNPHTVYLKAKDSLTTVSLTSYNSFNITVVAPAPEIVDIFPFGNSITLSWEQSPCNNATGYKLYRKNQFFGFEPGSCETGVPAYTGYELIANITGLQNISFVDDNNGAGLIHGIEYCYMVTAVFPDGAESYASAEWCASLKKDLPVITNVSVDTTDLLAGEMYVAWSKPTELDTIEVPGPYQYRIYNKDNGEGDEYQLVTTYFNLNDTLLSDAMLNTSDLQYTYRIDLFAGEESPQLVGSTTPTPSIFLNTQGSDKSVILSWNNNVPWTNDTNIVYRQNETTQQFDSIGYATEPFFADTGLINGKQYCYKIKTIGSYDGPGFVDPIINFSQENCGVPVDNIPPCVPELFLDVNCLVLQNDLSWVYPDTCEPEDLIYYIYYASTVSQDFALIDSVTTEFYTFSTDPPSVVGCFAITALDSLRNQSSFSNQVCVDINACGRIWFPLAFTPNGDGKNDYFLADSINSVNSLRLNIFNRWGGVVYETEDPYFQWDGTDQNNNGDCSPGTYFYEGVVSEFSLRGPIERVIRGTITLLR